MPKYILVAVEMPQADTGRISTQEWLGFLQSLPPTGLKSTMSEKLGENVWLLVRDEDVIYFAAIVSAAEAQGLKYSVRFLSSD